MAPVEEPDDGIRGGVGERHLPDPLEGRDGGLGRDPSRDRQLEGEAVGVALDGAREGVADRVDGEAQNAHGEQDQREARDVGEVRVAEAPARAGNGPEQAPLEQKRAAGRQERREDDAHPQVRVHVVTELVCGDEERLVVAEVLEQGIAERDRRGGPEAAHERVRSTRLPAHVDDVDLVGRHVALRREREDVLGQRAVGERRERIEQLDVERRDDDGRDGERQPGRGHPPPPRPGPAAQQRVEEQAEEERRRDPEDEREEVIAEPRRDRLLRDPVGPRHAEPREVERQAHDEEHGRDERDEGRPPEGAVADPLREPRAPPRRPAREGEPREDERRRDVVGEPQPEDRRRPLLCRRAPLGRRVRHEQLRLRARLDGPRACRERKREQEGGEEAVHWENDSIVVCGPWSVVRARA